MDQLFDSLSEDWVSHHGSPHSEQARHSPSVASSSSQLSNASQSRIPRFTSRTSSRLSNDRTASARRTSSIASNDSVKQPLREKTSSNLNTFNNKPLRKNAVKPAGASPKVNKTQKEQLPKTPSPPLPQDTVQHKVSPLKHQTKNGTPEWKRRLKSNTGSGDQQDLFSPIGLQSVFRPPTVKSKGGQKKGARYQPSAVDDMPSSPPSYPSRPRQLSATHAEDANPEGMRRLDALYEAAEEPQGEPHTRNSRPVANEAEKDQTFEADGRRSRQASKGQSPDVIDKYLSGDEETKRSPSERSRTPTPQKTESNKRREDSGLSHASAPSEHSRVTSGQTEDCNEGLSPFYISRQHTVDGQIDYAAVTNTEQLRQRMQDSVLQNRHRPSSRSSDDGIDYAAARPSGATVSQQYPSSDLTSHSLPEDLSTGTESFMANGGFVNPRRGGRSQEGSFMKRPLSPSSPRSVQTAGSPNASTVRRNSSGSSSKSPPKTIEEAASPLTPEGRKVDEASSYERPRSSGSPLKLFGKYDTYTNDRLARRMSKFEETMPRNWEGDDYFSVDRDQDSLKRTSRASSVSDPHSLRRDGKRQTSRISSFGEGELDDHPFESCGPLPPPDGREESRDPSLPERKPRLFRFERAEGDHSNSFSRRKRKKHPSTSIDVGDNTSQNLDPDYERTPRGSHNNQPIEVIWTAHGKRLPHSPAKDPQPKRRRTLLESELNIDLVIPLASPEVKTEATTKSMVGRTRKDALYDNSTQVADPGVLATRHILRPRNPTPSQSGHHGLHGANNFTVFGPIGRGGQINGVHRQSDVEPVVDATTEKLAEELASLALNVAQDNPDDFRKPSVTTADFFNEAQQIMQLIRARGRPPSSHISEEETAADPRDDDYDSKFLDSTRDEFSRPPSREGGSLRRLGEPHHLDARIVSQLRKFEENNDTGMISLSSPKSLKIAQPADTPITTELRNVVEQNGAELESDPNIRLLEHTAGSYKRKQSSSATEFPPTTTNAQPQSFASHSTSGPSTGRSIPTDSSRGSRNRAVIAPETVAHLLSDQVAGMTFDHEKQIWVKSRSSSKAEKSGNKGSASSEITDDDLLGAIPDLSVDEIEELRRVELVEYKLGTMASASDRVSNHDHARLDEQARPPTESRATSNSRPQTADRQQTGLDDISSAPSKYSHFASSASVLETRATSWGDEAFGRKPSGIRIASHRTEPSQQEEHAEEVEHEISIIEGRVSQTPNRKIHRQPRVVTVAFSSPLVDQIEASYLPQEEPQIFEDDHELDVDDSPAQIGSEKKLASSAKKASMGFRRASAYRSASRRMSMGPQSYIARPMSRLDEHEELSLIHGSNGAGMNVSLSTPLNRTSLVVPHASGQASSTGFQLSPLPDFTIHQIDRPLDRSLVTNGQALQTLHLPVHRVSLSTQEIVKKITDIEPYEPYWEYLRVMDLRNRGMLTLHMLSDFCARLEELDVSGNELGEVTGAPSSIRYLNVRRNCLSSLTAWGHLYNLQYLDVSSNQLTNLSGFQSLVHLRELKADDNQIESLQGVLALDGLIKLSLTRNRIGRVDFEEANL